MPRPRRSGPQSCDCCGRELIEFLNEGRRRAGWRCKHCGYDSRTGDEKPAAAWQVVIDDNLSIRRKF